MPRLDPSPHFDLGLDPEPDRARSRIARAYRERRSSDRNHARAHGADVAEEVASTQVLAADLAQRVREARLHSGGVDALMQEFSLDSEEGVALMCLAEALLRIPDAATRDALIRDKISRGDWRAHLGTSPSLFVNAAAWGLLLTGKLVATHSEERARARRSTRSCARAASR